jgi:hypothetical protein
LAATTDPTITGTAPCDALNWTWGLIDDLLAIEAGAGHILPGRDDGVDGGRSGAPNDAGAGFPIALPGAAVQLGAPDGRLATERDFNSYQPPVRIATASGVVNAMEVPRYVRDPLPTAMLAAERAALFEAMDAIADSKEQQEAQRLLRGVDDLHR